MPAGQAESEFLPLEALHKHYDDYLTVKAPERYEQRTARHYYHSDQWTSEELRILRSRGQPAQTKNYIARKINTVVGLIERLRQDPRASARTPKHRDGADLATATLKYSLDAQRWTDKSPLVALDGAVEGLGGVELTLEQGDLGDTDVGFRRVPIDQFFYDVRSYEPDLSDARYMGTSRWVDLDVAQSAFPNKAAALEGLLEDGRSHDHSPDRDRVWVNAQDKRLRLVDHWYLWKGKWRYCLYVHHTMLAEGVSPFTDEKGRTISKYVMYSAAVDHDGDRYGFVRIFKSIQDEINQRSSKALHILNSRRIILEKGAVKDIDRVRREWARPDGVVEVNRGFIDRIKPDEQGADFAGQLAMLDGAKSEIAEFGPTPQLTEQAGGAKSGRAIALLQQAGIAKLGPYILAYKGWKLRVYRALWSQIQRHWNAERWIRVTDNADEEVFLQLNGLGTDEWGRPAIVNMLGALDVDIVMDEGPDTVNMLADTFDALMALAANGQQVPPDVILELAPGIDNATRKRLIEGLRQPDPEAQAARQIAAEKERAEVGKAQAQIEKIKSETFENVTDAARNVAGLRRGI